MATLQPAAAERQIHLALSVEPALEAWSDPDQLRIIMQHLVDNALKFTPPGGEVAVAAEPGPTPRSVRIVVSDTGRGVSPEVKSRIFESFEQGDGALTRAHGGAGLGLSVTRRLVEVLGGRIAVESAASGPGSRFLIDLPPLT